MSKLITSLRLRLVSLNRWQLAWCIAACVWLLVSILITAYNFPTEARLRADWTSASERTLIGEKAMIASVDEECRKLASTSDYSASLMCIDNVLRMKSVYQDRLNGLAAYGEKRAQDERLPDQFSAVAHGIAWWAVPAFGLYLVGLVIRRLNTKSEKPLHRPTEQAVARDVFRWPDRTRRKSRSGYRP